MWDEITYPFPNFHVTTIKVWEWIRDFIQNVIGRDFLSMQGLKLINISKGGPIYQNVENNTNIFFAIIHYSICHHVVKENMNKASFL